MSPLEGLAQQASWTGKNVAYNLTFIPEDKLGWKPAPTAKSALDIVNELVTVLTAMKPVLSGGAWSPEGVTPITGLEDAKKVLTTLSDEYAEALRQVPAEKLQDEVVLPFATFPLARAAELPVMDLIHHHGQIAYIQTLLGDTESHFYEMDNQ